MEVLLRSFGARLTRAWHRSGGKALGCLIVLISAFAAMPAIAQGTPKTAGPRALSIKAQTAQSRPIPRVPTPVEEYRSSLNAVPPTELATYPLASDVQRLPFDSTIATISTCLRRPEEAIQACLEAGASNQACETDTSQCATAAEQAWQLYIAHYLRLLSTVLPAATPEAGQKAWTAYVDAECEFETAPYPDDPATSHNVDATCRAGKAEDRALELRDLLIDAKVENKAGR